MINRIKEIATFYSLSSTAFADKVEIPRPVISHIFSERNRPSLEVIQKIGMAFPEVDLEWLLYGRGEMLKKIAPREEKPEPYFEPSEREIAIPTPQEPEKVSLSGPITVSTPEPDPVHKVNKKKAVKIVFFFEDNTFEEFTT